MTTKTTIEFERVTGTEEATGVAITETVNADVLADGESVVLDLPSGGQWTCDQGELRAAIAR